MIEILRDLVCREFARHQVTLVERNKFKAALEEIRDTSYTSRAEVREVARLALLPKGHHDLS